MLAIFRFARKSRFRQEIIWVILAKLIGLYLLWWFFFSHPVKRTLTYPKLVQHFIVEHMTSKPSQ